MWQKGDWRQIATTMRKIYIAFDSDAKEKEGVSQQIISLWLFLKKRKADVKILLWSGEKGIDDYLCKFTDATAAMQELIKNAIQSPFDIFNISADYVAKKVATYRLKKHQIKEILGDWYKKQGIRDFDGMVAAYVSKNNRARMQNSYVEKNGCTWQLVEAGKGVEKKVDLKMVADFTARFTREISGKEIEREIEITAHNGKKCQFFVTGEELAEINLFRKRIGKNICVGYEATSIPAHNEFIRFLTKQSKIKQYKRLRHVGMIEKNLFVAHNCALLDGEEKSLDELAIIPPKSPTEVRIETQTDKTLLREVYETLDKFTGGQAWKVYGFIIASLYANQLAEKKINSPLLWLYGKTSSGKDTIADIIQCALGIQNNHVLERNLADKSTPKGLARLSTQYWGIPAKINEYTPSPEVNKEVCSYWDRTIFLNASFTTGNEVEQKEKRTSFILMGTNNIAGEKAEDVQARVVELNTWDTLGDPALRMKLCMTSTREKISGIVPLILRKINFSELAEAIENVSSLIQDALLENSRFVDGRIVKNYVILVEAFNRLAKSLDLQMVGWEKVEGEIISRFAGKRESNTAQIFLDNLRSMLVGEKISKNIAILEEKRILFRPLSITFPHVAEFSKRLGVGMEIKSLRESLLRMGINESSTRRWDGQKVEKCLVWIFEN
jgi:hypothetical protein